MYDVAVGCGVCAAVLMPLSSDENYYYRSKPVGTNVSSLTCEIEGIIFGLELSVEYFRTVKYRNRTETLYILCDCSEGCYC